MMRSIYLFISRACHLLAVRLLDLEVWLQGRKTVKDARYAELERIMHDLQKDGCAVVPNELVDEVRLLLKLCREKHIPEVQEATR
jgi:hypothetical protein